MIPICPLAVFGKLKRVAERKGEENRGRETGEGAEQREKPQPVFLPPLSSPKFYYYSYYYSLMNHSCHIQGTSLQPSFFFFFFLMTPLVSEAFKKNLTKSSLMLASFSPPHTCHFSCTLSSCSEIAEKSHKSPFWRYQNLYAHRSPRVFRR